MAGAAPFRGERDGAGGMSQGDVMKAADEAVHGVDSCLDDQGEGLPGRRGIGPGAFPWGKVLQAAMINSNKSLMNR